MLSPALITIPETISTLNVEEPSVQEAVVRSQPAGIVSWMEYVPAVTAVGPVFPVPLNVLILGLDGVGPVTIKSNVSSPNEASLVIWSEVGGGPPY